MDVKEAIFEKAWNEWDRMTAKVDLHLIENGSQVRISAKLGNEEVARLEASAEGSILTVRELFVEPEITVTKPRLFFSAKSQVPGRRRGYGSMLVKAAVAHARLRKWKAIEGEVPAAVFAKDRFALEWFSHRGFIITKDPAEPAGAGFKMLL